MDSSVSSLWAGPFLKEGVSGYFVLLPYLKEISIFNANSVDPEQILLLVLHCLPMSHLGDARHNF